MHVVQLANFVTETSGGIRVALDELGQRYVAAGHRRTLVVPGSTAARRTTPSGDVVVLPAPRLPGGAGYRVQLDRERVRTTLTALAPDAVEVHDRFTLAWVVPWLAARGVPTTLFVHERLAGSLAAFARVPIERARELELVANRRLVDRVGPGVVASASAARAFPTGGAEVVPLGVDPTRFRPSAPGPGPADEVDAETIVVAMVGRLSPEKRPDLGIGVGFELAARGRRFRLEVLGDGPMRRRLERRSPWGRVRFHGHVGRDGVAAVLARADVLVAPCPTEAFGLAALEALASGVPVVAHRDGGVGELLGLAGDEVEADDDAPSAAPDDDPPDGGDPEAARTRRVGMAGAVAAGRARHLTDALEELLRVDPALRRRAALERATRYRWEDTAALLLARHGTRSVLAA